MLEWTGERYLPYVDPGVCGSEIHYEHLHRYAFAAHFVNNQMVLDLACGEGYGSSMLSAHASSVVGIDIDRDTIRQARKNYETEKCTFVQGSIVDIPIKGERLFDIIVCYEAIEHIENHAGLIREVKRLLKRGGLFILSTPNKRVYSDKNNYQNPFHLKELTIEDIKALLQDNFAHHVIFGQQVMCGSHIWDLTANRDSRTIDFVLQKEGAHFSFIHDGVCEPQYMIAVATDGDIDNINALKSNIFDSSNVLINQRDNYIQHLQREFERLRGSSDVLIQQKDECIRGLESAVEQLEAELLTERTSRHCVEKELHDIQQSTIFRLLKMFDQKVIGHLCPPGSRRLDVYNLFLHGGRTLITEGPRGLASQYSERRKRFTAEGEKERKHQITRAYDWRKTLTKPKKAFTFPCYEGVPLFSIIISVRDYSEYLSCCLQSISESRNECSYEVIVVEDHACETAVSLIESIEGVRVIRCEERGNGTQIQNIGAVSARGSYLVFLDGEAAVPDGWLDILHRTFKLAPSAGIVGGKVVSPKGYLRSAGGILLGERIVVPYGFQDDPDKPQYNYLRQTDVALLPFISIPTLLFKRIGGFEECFQSEGHGDIELASKVISIGNTVLYQPEVPIVWFNEKNAVATMSGTNRKLSARNDVASQRWIKIKRLSGELDLDPERERDRGFRRRVLIIDAVTPMPDKDSGSLRMVTMMETLLDVGSKVTFIPSNLEYHPKYSSKLQQRGIEVLYGNYISIRDYLTKCACLYDVIVISRADIADRFLPYARRSAPNSIIIFDTVDLHFLREERQAEIEKSTKLCERAQKRKSQELRLIEMADVTFVVSPVEQQIIRELLPHKNVQILSNIHDVHGRKNALSERDGVLFIGGFLHTPNVDAVTYYIREIHPVVERELGSVPVYIVGSNPPPEVTGLASDRVFVTGFVPDVEPYFERCRLSIAPLRYGAGVKGKINMSMSYGLPVVATPIAAEGMYLKDEQDILIGDTAETFAKAVIRLYRDEQLWEKISQNGILNVKQHFSRDRARETLKNVLYAEHGT